MAQQPPSSTLPDAEWSPQAAVCAWLWPGLGHIVLGERKRGVLIMIGMCFMILVGALVGGVDTVDRRQDGYWFMAQMFCGPVVFGLDWANQKVVHPQDFDWQDEQERAAFQERDPEMMQRLSRPSIGRVNEMGTLFIAMAGLMNLVVILDALHYRPRQAPPEATAHRRRTTDETKDKPAAEAGSSSTGETNAATADDDSSREDGGEA